MSISSIPVWKHKPAKLENYQVNSTAISADGSVCLVGTSEERASGDFKVYCYDDTGNVSFSDDIANGSTAYQGVFWVAVSADGKYGAAGGINKAESTSTDGTTSEAVGFLYAYNITTKKRIFTLETQDRVNEVALSKDGQYLLAVAGTQILFFKQSKNTYKQIGEPLQIGPNDGEGVCQSCQISEDGTRGVIGYTHYYKSAGKTLTTGMVIALELSDTGIDSKSINESKLGIYRTAMTPDGQWWASTAHDGTVALFNSSHDNGAQPVWTYTPSELDVSVSYAIAIAKKEDTLYVSVGVNVANNKAGNGGAVLTLSSPASVNNTPSPTLEWTFFTEYGVNPGVNMDNNAIYVTATDGKPKASTGLAESAGNFYLFDISRANSPLIWNHNTSMMNWPMSISADGSTIVGASDNGYVYYWKEVSQSK